MEQSGAPSNAQVLMVFDSSDHPTGVQGKGQRRFQDATGPTVPDWQGQGQGQGVRGEQEAGGVQERQARPGRKVGKLGRDLDEDERGQGHTGGAPGT